MLKFGLINELGAGENLGFARVEFDEHGIVSDWLSLPCSGSKSAKAWVTFPVNTQVAVLMHDDGEQGVILNSVWSDVDGPPSFASNTTRGIEFPDGMKIIYDWNTHKLSVSSANEIEINGGSKGGLINIADLLQAINALETKSNLIVASLTALAAATNALGPIPLLGTIYGALLTAAIVPVVTPTVPTLRATIEDTKVTH